MQQRIEDFMQRHAITPTTFGLWAMNDSRFVFDVRAGRDCMGSTIRRVLSFMEEYEAKQEAKRLRLAKAEHARTSSTPPIERH